MKIYFSDVICEIPNRIKMSSHSEYIVAAISFS